MKLYVTLADDEHKQKKGLSGRKHLSPDKGMLFVFKELKHLSYWMKDTLIPIELSFIDQNFIIREQYDLIPMNEKSVKSKHKYIYALETVQGVLKENGIGIGSMVDLSNKLLNKLK